MTYRAFSSPLCNIPASDGPGRSALVRGLGDGVGETGPVSDGRPVAVDGPQATVAAALPGAAALGLLPAPGARPVPAARLADPSWTAAVLADRGQRQDISDRRVLATVWWYSASSALLTPPLAGLVTGRPLSARLCDTTLYALSGSLLVAAVSSAAGPPSAAELAIQLRDAMAPVIAAVATAGGMRERPLWAIATDSLANRLLALGRALEDVPGTTALAAPLAAAIGAPLPIPRYVHVRGNRFTRRCSCCLIYRMPHESLCTSCPRRPPAERRALLEGL